MALDLLDVEVGVVVIVDVTGVSMQEQTVLTNEEAWDRKAE